MYRVYFDCVTALGAYIPNMSLCFDQKPDEIELIGRLKKEGFAMYRLPHMPKLVKI